MTRRLARGRLTGRQQHEIALSPEDWDLLGEDATRDGGSRADALERALAELRRYRASRADALAAATGGAAALPASRGASARRRVAPQIVYIPVPGHCDPARQRPAPTRLLVAVEISTGPAPPNKSTNPRNNYWTVPGH